MTGCLLSPGFIPKLGIILPHVFQTVPSCTVYPRNRVQSVDHEKKAITNKTAPRTTNRSPTVEVNYKSMSYGESNRGWRSGIHSRKV
jgi:hypothetical protein